MRLCAVARVRHDGGIPQSMLCVVHDGVDPARVRLGDRTGGRQSLRLADDETLLLTVANLTDHKGHRFLLDALPAVFQQFPRLTVALAGDGELRETLSSRPSGWAFCRESAFWATVATFPT